MTRSQPSEVGQRGRDGEAETSGQTECPQEPKENRPQVKRRLDDEQYETDRPTKIVRTDKPSPGAIIGQTDPAPETLQIDTLCSRCIGLNLNIPKENCPSFKVVSRLGSMEELLHSPECRLCELLYKVRPISSKANSQDPSDCSLVLFDGKWARPWKARPSPRAGEILRGSSKTGDVICFDTFATMDNETMFGVLPTEEINDSRFSTVPYLHDRLYETLTKSGYIRVAQDQPPEISEIWGPKPVGSKVNWDLLRKCVKECAFNDSYTCPTDYDNAYKPLNVIDCRSRKVVRFPEGVQYLALSYIWGSEQSDESSTSHEMLSGTIPTTISDAMEATLQLGFHFLWVDRYCIPQNLDHVKHTEIRHMDMIYRGAAVTIVACSGMSPWHGLPGCSTQLRSGSSCVTIGDQVLFSVPPDPRYEIEASKWMSRGWTYQEGLLSRRRIFFTDEQVYFECDSRHCFESTAPLLNKLLWESSQKARIFSIGGKAVGRHDFYKTVSEYSGRQLTYESDILNGVWGVLRTFQNSKYPIHHYWGVPVYAKQSGYDFIAGFAWDLVKPARRRAGFPSWSWAGWIGQVKPGLLVRLEHAPKNVSFLPQYRLPTSPNLATSSSEIEKSSTVESPQDILQVNLPSSLEEDINLSAERVNGTTMSFQKASLQYFAIGVADLSPFLNIAAWMAPVTVSNSGIPKATIFSPRHPHGYDSIQWLPTIDEVPVRRSENPILKMRSCTAILLAARERLSVPRQRVHLYQLEDIETVEEEEVNKSWVCLFLVVEDKGDYYERIGLAKFLFSSKLSMRALMNDLKIEKRGIRLG
ncbi:HET-domain-containing protein [Stipitochalara longipes BDJ]|nr:HET-domain-containing protein [Stipitochalara longipes BDJ]